MKAFWGVPVLVLALARGGEAQSLLQGDGSPYDPPRKPAVRLHDHVKIEFEDRAKAPGTAEPRPQWDAEVRQWVRAEAKAGAPLSAVLTAEVVDIRPNGTLVLEAWVRRSLNQDQETLRFLGEIAPAHVSFGRASSESLAHVSLAYEGSAGEAAKPGLLGWLLGKLWPF